MAQITAALVKELREKTSAGMMDCKKALNETNGDLEAAADWLRTKGIAKADKKASRVAAEGLVAIALDGTTGAVVEVNSETDFVARNDGFQAAVTEVSKGKIGVLIALESTGDKAKLEELGKKIAMHVAATSPLALSIEDLDSAVVDKERNMLKAEAIESGKPEAIVDKMVEGRMVAKSSRILIIPCK